MQENQHHKLSNQLLRCYMLYLLGRVNGIALNHDALRHETSASYATIIKEEECTDQCRDDYENVKTIFNHSLHHKTYLLFAHEKESAVRNRF